MPKDQTSDLCENVLERIASGGIHFTGRDAYENEIKKWFNFNNKK